MNEILIKLFATALTLSQVTTRPDSVRTEFDPVADRPKVVQILRDGCAHMRKAFDIEDINLDDLIATAMEDPKAVAGDAKVLEGLNFSDLNLAYRQFCKNENVENPGLDLGAVIQGYNKAVADLPDHASLKEKALPAVSTVLDGQGRRFAEVFEPDGRRIPVPLKDVPEVVRKAFVAAEDKRFYEHRGIDERGVIRAFVANLAKPGRPQGGSTITQQLAKNLLVGDDVTYQRKMREMIVASRIERTLSKDEILGLYLNQVYLGRASWGVEMAARSFFGKSVSQLGAAEAALLATLPKGPNFYDPDRHPERFRDRLAYVANRMREDGAIDAETAKRIAAEPPRLVAQERPRRDTGFALVDLLNREVRTSAGLEGLTGGAYTVRSTVDPALQRATEAALQEGLARYEMSTGRQLFSGAEGNLADAVAKLEAADKAAGAPPQKPAWARALEARRAPLADVRWPSAVVLSRGRQGEAMRVGLADGRVVPLTAWSSARAQLKPYDVVHVRVVETRAAGRTRDGAARPASARAELRARPNVQGAAVVLENRTGRILAMSGGFSYQASQLNRATQAHRQPGSTLKPLTYLAALATGLQPNTLVWDTPVTLPPVGGGRGDHWSPRNYDRGSSGITTLRRALENSKNLVTARLLDGAISERPEASLRRVCELALEAQIYAECEPYYPFVLGSQPVRVVDMAALYAAIANEGFRPTPHTLESVALGAKEIYRRPDRPAARMGSADRVAFYQLKTILQGVVERGTAASLRSLAPYVGGKTGTSEGENDAWFVGFTNDVTIAVWVGYDNADGKRRTLGRGQTGGKVALPIFGEILRSAWGLGIPKQPLLPPSSEAATQMVDLSIDLRTGDRVSGGGFREHFRLDRTGRFADTQHRLVGREEAYAYRYPGPAIDDGSGWPDDRYYGAPEASYPAERYRSPVPQWNDPYAAPQYDDPEPPRRRPRRVDPDYFWGTRPYY